MSELTLQAFWYDEKKAKKQEDVAIAYEVPGTENTVLKKMN